MQTKMNRAERIKSALQVLIGGHVVVAGIATYAGNESWYRKWLMPTLNIFGSETTQKLIVKAAQYKLIRAARYEDPQCLNTHVWSLPFSNPICLAAGFDREAVAVDGLLQMGFGAVEVGNPTSPGWRSNCEPESESKDKTSTDRRRSSDHRDAVFNRLKSWSDSTKVESPLNTYSSDDRNILNENFPSPDRPGVTAQRKRGHGIVGVGLRLALKQTSTDLDEESVDDLEKFSSTADYVVVDSSEFIKSGLRTEKHRHRFKNFIEKILNERDAFPAENRPPLLVRVPSDISEVDRIYIASILANPLKSVDGIIIISDANSQKPDVVVGAASSVQNTNSTEVIREMFKLTQGKLAIVSVGEVSTGLEAYEKICAGASLLQLSTSLRREGPPVVVKIKQQLAEILQENGFDSVADAVGSDFRPSQSKENIDKT